MHKIFSFLMVAFTLISHAYAAEPQGEEVCYHRDEYLAEELLSFMFSQGFAAVKCDDLLNTNIYEKLHKEVFEAHKVTLEEFTKPTEKLISRNGWKDNDYVLTLTQLNYNYVEAQTINAKQCKAFFEEMQIRKVKWKRIISPLLATIILSENPNFNECKE